MTKHHRAPIFELNFPMPLYVEAIRPQRLRPLRAPALAVAATLGLTACSLWRHEPPPVVAPLPAAVALHPVTAPPPSPVHEPVDAATPSDLASRRALAHHDLLRALPPAELAQEIARLSALPPSPEASIDLAMALLLTRNGAEQNRAIGLVEPLAKGSVADAEAWQPMARLLLARLLELRRLEELLERRNQDLRDSQREVRQLNEKLEALKAIERSLAPRPSSSGTPSGMLNSAASAPNASSLSASSTRAKAAPRKSPS